jgi:hypothetical protein
MLITSSIVKFQPGMYILRHPKGGLAPLGIARAPAALPDDGRMTLIATENAQGSILRDGSDCIVLHISGAAVDLLVTAYLARQGDPVPALRVDKIGLDEPGTAAAPAPAPVTAPGAPVGTAAAPIRIGPHGISVIGHIERNGDQVAGPGEQLGDPAAALRIEGFQVMWPDRPQGVDLAYGIEIEGAGYTPVVKSGKFCGSKGAAKRITEVTFSLVGPEAERFELAGTAHFSGGVQLPIRSGMPLRGPSGLEHLTALSLRAAVAATTQAQPNPWDASARTTIFKAGGEAPSTRAAGKPDKMRSNKV